MECGQRVEQHVEQGKTFDEDSSQSSVGPQLIFSGYILFLFYQRYPQIHFINWPHPADEGLGQTNPGAGEGHPTIRGDIWGTYQSEGGTLFPGQSL